MKVRTLQITLKAHKTRFDLGEPMVSAIYVCRLTLMTIGTPVTWHTIWFPNPRSASPSLEYETFGVSKPLPKDVPKVLRAKSGNQLRHFKRWSTLNVADWRYLGNFGTYRTCTNAGLSTCAPQFVSARTHCCRRPTVDSCLLRVVLTQFILGPSIWICWHRVPAQFFPMPPAFSSHMFSQKNPFLPIPRRVWTVGLDRKSVV